MAAEERDTSGHARQVEAIRTHSQGHPRQRLELAFADASFSFKRLEALARLLQFEPIPVVSADEFAISHVEREAAADLGRLFDRYGSDKASHHDYHKVYGPIFARIGNVEALCEVGLGTNNEDVVSNMTHAGSPGASLRAFRDFLPQARVFGADIDKRVLFSEDRIETFFVDQTDPATFEALPLGDARLDLVIDDGLHAPAANITVLNFAVEALRPGGWIVIEDTIEAALPVWQVVGALMSGSWRCQIIRARGGFLFLAEHRA
jgi:SAM-dependent methyltransferase